MSWYSWAPYVPVAERRRRARSKMDSLRKRVVDIQPVEIGGRKIAKTFWGESWCEHLESFSDFANRLPRGRTYVRNGSVCHLAIAKGKIEAKVSGSDIYEIDIQIKTLPKNKWAAVKKRCAGRIGSLLELLEGNLSDHVMEVVTDRQNGLFPLPGEIALNCDCPDWAVMCKHVAATLYGVGARLDEKPELLFTLRGVNHEELIDADAEAAVGAATRSGKAKRLASKDLSDVFGIELDAPAESRPTPKKAARKKSRSTSRKTAKEKTTRKKAARKVKKKTAKKTSPKKKTVKKKSVKKKTTTQKKSPKKITKKSAPKKTAKGIKTKKRGTKTLKR